MAVPPRRALHARARFRHARLAAPVLLGAALLSAVPLLRGGQVACEPPVLLALLAAAAVMAALVVRLPHAVPISLLAAVLLPSWLTCGGAVTAAVALGAGLIGGGVRTWAWSSTLLGAVGALVGVLSGNLAAVAIAASGLLGPWGSERLLAGGVFMVAYWLGEHATLRVAGGLGANAVVARSNVLANLLLLFPGTVLAEMLVARGFLLFGPMLLLLVAALALIALYLAAETAREGAADEQARLRSIVANVPEGIFAVGSDLRLEWVNDAAGRLTGSDPTTAVGQPCAEVVKLRRPDGGMVDHREAFERAAEAGRAVQAPGTILALDGQARTVVVSYTAVADRAGGLQVGVGALREAEAHEELEERAADLGHELRSPLSTILGYARLMASLPAGSLNAERQAEFVGRINEAGDYMLRLVNNLLDLRQMESGAEPLQPTVLQVHSLLSAALVMIGQRADEKSIVTTLDVEPGLPSLVTDELLARRALDNLLSNAVKYTPPGGSVRLTAAREGEGVAIVVTDTGIGLTEDERARLFERFFRGSRPEARAERGTGLGLALVQEAARRLGGTVRVTGAVGTGSTFTLWLPFRAEWAASSEQ